MKRVFLTFIFFLASYQLWAQSGISVTTVIGNSEGCGYVTVDLSTNALDFKVWKCQLETGGPCLNFDPDYATEREYCDVQLFNTAIITIEDDSPQPIGNPYTIAVQSTTPVPLVTADKTLTCVGGSVQLTAEVSGYILENGDPYEIRWYPQDNVNGGYLINNGGDIVINESYNITGPNNKQIATSTNILTLNNVTEAVEYYASVVSDYCQHDQEFIDINVGVMDVPTSADLNFETLDCVTTLSATDPQPYWYWQGMESNVNLYNLDHPATSPYSVTLQGTHYIGAVDDGGCWTQAFIQNVPYDPVASPGILSVENGSSFCTTSHEVTFNIEGREGDVSLYKRDSGDDPMGVEVLGPSNTSYFSYTISESTDFWIESNGCIPLGSSVTSNIEHISKTAGIELDQSNLPGAFCGVGEVAVTLTPSMLVSTSDFAVTVTGDISMVSGEESPVVTLDNGNFVLNDNLTLTAAADATISYNIVVTEPGGCGSASSSFDVTLRPDNAAGEMLFAGASTPPVFNASTSQTVRISMTPEHVGKAVDIRTKAFTTSSWTNRGSIPVGGYLDVSFSSSTYVKAVSQATVEDCLSDAESTEQSIIFDQNSTWGDNGFPVDQLICSDELFSFSFSYISGIDIYWEREVIEGVIQSNSAVNSDASTSDRLIRQRLDNTGISNAVVKFTIQQREKYTTNVIQQDIFFLTVKPNNLVSDAGFIIASPFIICGASEGLINLSSTAKGNFTWHMQPSGGSWQSISNPENPILIDTTTLFQISATGECVSKPYTWKTVYVVPVLPQILNELEDHTICSGGEFDQIIDRDESEVVKYSSYKISGNVPNADLHGVTELPIEDNSIAHNITNVGTTPAVVRYTVWKETHGCSGQQKTFDVIVLPEDSPGTLAVSDEALCSPGPVQVFHNDFANADFNFSIWNEEDGWLPLDTIISGGYIDIQQTSILKVELNGSICPTENETFAVSNTIEVIDLSNADIYIEQELSCTSTTVKKIDDDMDSWYWQPDENSFDESDNVQSKTLTEGTLLYLRKKESDCWGPIKIINVSFLDQPITLASDIHRFGAGKAALSATPSPGLRYQWTGAGGFSALSATTVFEDVPLGITAFDVQAISDAACASAASIPVQVTAHPVPRSAMNGPQFLNPSQPTSIYLNNSYSNIKWYRDGDEMIGETGTSIDITTAGAYWARITLPDGTAMNTAPIQVMDWGNDKLPVPAQDGPQPPSSSLTNGEELTPMNYTRVLAAREAESEESALNIGRSPSEVAAVTSYSDGLGRQVQSVARGTSFSGKDQVGIAEYDALGRSTRQYMSYTATATNGAFRVDPFSEQSDYYDSPDQGIAATTRPYSQVLYEASPLNRVIETAASGEAWDPGSDWDDPSRKTTKYPRRTNHSGRDGDIQRYFLTGVMLDSYGTYANHSLRVSEMIDPMHNVVQTFTTKRGQTVLRRVKGENDQWADTYYVYDDLDNLTLILTPEAVRIIGTPDYANSNGIAIVQEDMTLDDLPVESYVYGTDVAITLTDGFHAQATDVDSVFTISPGNVDIVIPTQNFTAYEAFQHLYLFEYDSRRRLTRKKVPGADWEIYAYDQWDRLVLSQGGHMRENGLSQYNFIKYDQWSRPVMSGVVSITDPIATIRADLMSHSVRHETTTPTGEIGYTINSTYPTIAVAADVHNVAYFDDYSFPEQPTYDFVPGAGYTAAAYQDTAVTSLMTGARTRILDNNGGWLRSAYYYDYKYRPIHSVSDNATGGIDHAYQHYAFRGVVEQSILVHNTTSATSLKVTREYSYDHMDRLLSVTHQLGDITTDKVTLASYEYNELGQVITQNLHQADGETDYLQQMDLRYHIHGQLTAINDPDNPSTNNGRLKDVFALKLDYEQGYERSQYGGQITGATWYNRSHMEESPATSTFGYVYDTRQQLRMADYSGADDYTTRVTEYDQNGNIKALERQGKTEVATGMIDQLQYDYLANQLQSVDDQSAMDGGYTDGTNSSLELEYDNSGNLTRERNKGVSAVTYNHLNLPTRIELDNSRSIEYIYNGSGTRLRAEYYEGAEMVKKITYAGQFYYEDDELSQVFTETGRIVNDDNGRASGAPDAWDGVDYQYMMADHLGNSRAVLSSIPERHVTVTATHEEALISEEAKVFDNLHLRENNIWAYDHTKHTTVGAMDHNYVKLEGVADIEEGDFSNIGTMAMLQVQAGDRVDLRAYAKYDEDGSQNDLAPAGVIAGLVNAFGFNPASGESGTVFDLFDQALGAIGVMGDGSGGEPEAYLQYLFFDRDFNFVDSPGIGYAYDQVSGLAAVNAGNRDTKQHEELSLSRDFLEDGYLFVFVSNSSQGTSVYFDDLTIDYTMNPVDQANDYYPFGGLMGSGFERIISKANDFRYQGKEYDKDLQWYDFHARQYDPYLGRFLAADPMMQFSSPYNGMGNNPISIVDPTGMLGTSRSSGTVGGTENDNDQDDEINVLSNGYTADAWEREVAAHYAMFDSWLGGMNGNGPSYYDNRNGVGNGSYGTGEHQAYSTAVEAAAQAGNGARAVNRGGRWGVMYMVSDGHQQVGTFDDTGTPIMMETFSPEFMYVASPDIGGTQQGWLGGLLAWTGQFFKGGIVSMGRAGVGWALNWGDRKVLHAELMDTQVFPFLSPKLVPTSVVNSIGNHLAVGQFAMELGVQSSSLFNSPPEIVVDTVPSLNGFNYTLGNTSGFGRFFIRTNGVVIDSLYKK